MANLDNFNAHEVEPSTSFEPLPEGNYLAAMRAGHDSGNSAGRE